MAKPVVDGIERALTDTEARLIKLSVGSSIGRAAAGRYGVRGVPTLVVTDGAGDLILRQVGRIDKDAVLGVLG